MRSASARIIEIADTRAETLIGWFRIAVSISVIAVIATLVYFSGEISRIDRLHIVLTGLVVGFSLLVGVAAIVLVRSGVYRRWMAWLFSISDIIVILGALFISMSVDGVSSLVVFSNPLFFLVFAFISVQAFRFRTDVQIAIAVLLILGVGALVFSAPSDLMGQPTIDYLAAAFSTEANIARLAILVLVAGLSAFAVWRAKRMLVRVADKTERHRNIARFLPAELVQEATDTGLRDLRKGMSLDLIVMFVDLRGFTSLSEELGPERTADMLSGYRGLITDAVVPRHGIVDKFVGDGALIVFGFKEDLDTAATSALEAAREIEESVAAWSKDQGWLGSDGVGVVMALHRGPVIAITVGTARRMEFTIVGCTVNVGSRMEAYAKARDLSLVVSASVLEAGGIDRDRWTSLGFETFRGQSEPVELFARGS